MISLDGVWSPVRQCLASEPSFCGRTDKVASTMRRGNYVDDSLGALRSPPFDVDLRLYEAFGHM